MSMRIVGKRIFFDVSQPQFLLLLSATSEGWVHRTVHPSDGEVLTEALSLGKAAELIRQRKGGTYVLEDGNQYFPKLTIRRPA